MLMDFLSFFIFITFCLCCKNESNNYKTEYNKIKLRYQPYENYTEHSAEHIFALATNAYAIIFYDIKALSLKVKENYDDCESKIKEEEDKKKDEQNKSYINDLNNTRNAISSIYNKIKDLNTTLYNKTFLKQEHGNSENNCIKGQYSGLIDGTSKTGFVTRKVYARLDGVSPFIFNFANADIYIGNFDYGGIMIGLCEMNITSNTQTSKIDEDKNLVCDVVSFTGINIAYFGDNCYHVDYFVKSQYTRTGRSCLSKYELYLINLEKSTEMMTLKLGLESDPFFQESINKDKTYMFCGSILNNMTLLDFKNIR